MAWTSSLLFGVLLTSVTGGLFQIIWMIFQGLVLRKDAKVTYICLKAVMLSYMVPFGYIFLLREQRGQAALDGLFVITPDILKGFQYVALLWLAVTVFLIIKRVLCYVRLNRISLYNEEVEDPKVREIFEELLADFGISKEIQIYYNTYVPSPMIHNMLSPEILLPEKRIREKELRIILAHELTHYKNRDLFVKFTSIIINSIYCFNPMSYLLAREINIWSEMNCDVDTCRRAASHFTVREYCETIVTGAFRSREVLPLLSSAFIGRESDVERRIRQMVKFQKNGCFKRSTAALLIGIFVISSSMTATAAGGELAETYEDVWETTRVDRDETLTVLTTNNKYQEYCDNIHNIDPDKIIEAEEEQSMTRAYVRTIDWVIPSGSFMRTSPFKVEVGQQLSFTVGIIPKDKDIRMGIIEPDGTMRYIHGMERLSHTFDFNVKGYHNFYCENTSDASINVVGSWVRDE